MIIVIVIRMHWTKLAHTCIEGGLWCLTPLSTILQLYRGGYTYNNVLRKNTTPSDKRTWSVLLTHTYIIALPSLDTGTSIKSDAIKLANYFSFSFYE